MTNLMDKTQFDAMCESAKRGEKGGAVARARIMATEAQAARSMLAEKDAQIKSLADALIAERELTGVGECQCREDYKCVACRGADALRLVGRL